MSEASADALLRAAEQALSKRDYRQAHELCIQALQQGRAQHALYLLAVIAIEHGAFAKAATVLERAIESGAPRAQDHAQLARCLVKLGRPKDAVDVARRAAALPILEARTADTLGVVLSSCGRHAEALEFYRRAAVFAPSNSGYAYNLAAALAFNGELEAARAAYRTLLAADPDRANAWSALAQLEKAPFTREQCAHLRMRLASEDLDPDARLHLAHALAKQLEDTHAYAEAFEVLTRAKRCKRDALRYSIEDDLRRFEVIRNVCNEQWLNAPHTSRSEDAPIFIVGMPRSGTTLLERVLSSHPQVRSGGEMDALGIAVKRAAGTRSPFVLDADTLMQGAAGADAKLAAHYLELARASVGDAARFIDKTPLNFFFGGLIHRALPNARIICMRRYALDVCLSNYRQLFSLESPYYHYSYDLLDLGKYFLGFDELARHWRRILPADRYREVWYEALLDDPEQEAGAVMDFCGLEWRSEYLAFETNRAPVATASVAQVREPLNQSSRERWRRYEQELAPLRAVLGARIHERSDASALF